MELNLYFDRIYSSSYEFQKFEFDLNLNQINLYEKEKTHCLFRPNLASLN
jgi:hypothetical protein